MPRVEANFEKKHFFDSFYEWLLYKKQQGWVFIFSKRKNNKSVISLNKKPKSNRIIIKKKIKINK